MFKRIFLAVLASSGVALAGNEVTNFKKSVIEPEPEMKSIERTEISASAAYVGSSDFERGNGKFGDQSAFESAFYAAHRFALSDQWYLKLGASYHRFDFSTSDAPVDTTLQGVAAVVGLEYVVNGEVGLFISSSPGFYFSDDITSRAFDIPTNAAFAYEFVDNRAYLILGVSYAGMREYPVLPLVGLLWKINSQWTLKAYLPEPRLIYQPTKKLAFWAGGELAGGSFRTSEHSGGPDRIDHAVVDYSEYRGGGGVTYAVCEGFTVDLAAGYVFHRGFDYHRAEDVYDLEGAPYVKIGAAAKF